MFGQSKNSANPSRLSFFQRLSQGVVRRWASSWKSFIQLFRRSFRIGPERQIEEESLVNVVASSSDSSKQVAVEGARIMNEETLGQWLQGRASASVSNRILYSAEVGPVPDRATDIISAAESEADTLLDTVSVVELETDAPTDTVSAVEFEADTPIDTVSADEPVADTPTDTVSADEPEADTLLDTVSVSEPEELSTVYAWQNIEPAGPYVVAPVTPCTPEAVLEAPIRDGMPSGIQGPYVPGLVQVLVAWQQGALRSEAAYCSFSPAENDCQWLVDFSVMHDALLAETSVCFSVLSQAQAQAQARVADDDSYETPLVDEPEADMAKLYEDEFDRDEEAYALSDSSGVESYTDTTTTANCRRSVFCRSFEFNGAPSVTLAIIDSWVRGFAAQHAQIVPFVVAKEVSTAEEQDLLQKQAITELNGDEEGTDSDHFEWSFAVHDEYDVPNDYLPSAESVHPLYQLSIDGFEGPLDLLLLLIRRHKIDVFDIPIGFICDAYLGCLKAMDSLELDVAAEFLMLASELLHIKSKMLLPKPVEVNDEYADNEDPRAELVRRLLEYQKYKKAAEEFDGLCHVGRDVFGRGAERLPAREGLPPLKEGSSFDLVNAMAAIFKRQKPDVVHRVVMEQVSVRRRIARVIDLVLGRDVVPFEVILADISHQIEMVASFLAILEMTKLKLLKIYQSETGDIFISARFDKKADADAMLGGLQDEYA